MIPAGLRNRVPRPWLHAPGGPRRARCVGLRAASGPVWRGWALLLALLPSLSAQVLYWDTNGSRAGSGSTPDGTWKNASSASYKAWSTSADGTATTTHWTDGRDAVFAAGSDAAWSSYTVTVDGTVKPGAISVQDGRVTFEGGTLNWNDSSPDFNVDLGSWATVNSTVLAGYQGLNKTGYGGLTLSGANTYTGVTTVSAGVLSLTHSQALGSTTTWGNQVLSGATLALSNDIAVTTGQFSIGGTGVLGQGALYNASGDNRLNATVSLTSAATLQSAAGSLTIAGGGNLELNANLTVTGSGNTTLSNQIYGAGSLTKTGSGTLTFNGTVANSFNGDLNVNAGTVVLAKSDGQRATGQGQLNIGSGSGPAGAAIVRLDGNEQIADYLSSVNVRQGGVLQVNNHTESINVLQGTGGEIDLGSSGQLTVGINSGSSRFAGTLSGTGNLIKAGQGTLTLDSDIDFAGTVTLQAGTLALGGHTISLGTLSITGNSIIDFGTGLGSTLFVDNLFLSSGVTLTIKGWIDTIDAFYATFWSGATPDLPGSAPSTQIVFQGFTADDTRWVALNGEVTPLPETAATGAVLAAGGLLGWALRRRRPPGHPVPAA